MKHPNDHFSCSLNLVMMSIQVMDDGLCFSSALPWILLYKLTCWKEQEEVDQVVPSGSLPASLALLNTAHELLGQKSACTLEQGRREAHFCSPADRKRISREAV